MIIYKYMKLLQMPRFKKHVKKLPRQYQQIILDAVEDLMANPEVGPHENFYKNLKKYLKEIGG